MYIFDFLPIYVCLGYNEDKKKDTNPFSFKNFLSDDLASRNKRVLQVFVFLLNLPQIGELLKSSERTWRECISSVVNYL